MCRPCLELDVVPGMSFVRPKIGPTMKLVLDDTANWVLAND